MSVSSGIPGRPATASEPGAPAPHEEIDFARRVLGEERGAIEAAEALLDESFCRAVSLIVACAEAGGTVLVTGLGKSGHIGAKVAATFSSLGIASHAVHPAEAAHGDLGRFRATDTVLCLSRSGETDEVVNLAAILHQDGLPIISITGGAPGAGARTSLERLATVALHIGEFAEAGDGLEAPTASTTATLALGDALALAAARRRSFGDADFARRHPGGTIGGLLRPVVELLRFRVDENSPPVPDSCAVLEALQANGGRRAGAVLLVDPRGRLSGIYTDADFRRGVLERGPGDWLTQPVSRVMTRSPTVLSDRSLVRDAVRMIRERRQDEIPIVDADGRPVGILDVQDLIAMRLVRDDG